MVCGLLQEEPEVPFTEEDYRRRRSHPNFTDHIALEKLVIKVGKTVSGLFKFYGYTCKHPCMVIGTLQDKSKLTSYMVAAGLTYGAGESIFHFLFKVRRGAAP